LGAPRTSFQLWFSIQIQTTCWYTAGGVADPQSPRGAEVGGGGGAGAGTDVEDGTAEDGGGATVEDGAAVGGAVVPTDGVEEDPLAHAATVIIIVTRTANRRIRPVVPLYTRYVVRPLVLVFLAGVLLVAGGCGTGKSAAQRGMEQTYVAYVHQSAPDIGTFETDAKLINLGHAVCDGFRSRANTQQIADLLERTGGRRLPPSDVGAVISGAVNQLCPTYSGRLSPVGR
jgi:hypothetical protein